MPQTAPATSKKSAHADIPPPKKKRYTNLAPLIDHLYTASHLSTHARTFPNDLSAAADALIHWHHYLRCGAAQYTAVFCLTLTPHLRSLDITWAGVGPCAAFAGPSWLRTTLPQLETLIVRACGPRGKNGRKGWYRNEEWTFPEWAAGGALAAGHPSLKRVEFCDGSAAELGAAAVAAAEAEAEAASVLESLELSGCGMPPARLAEVLRAAARNCARVEEVRVGLVHPITVPFAYPSTWPVPYSKRKTVVRLGEVGDALRGLLGPVPGSGEGGRGGFDSWLYRTVGHSKLRTMSVKLDFITPKGSVRCAGGGEVGYNGVEWGVSGRLGTLRGFEKLQYLEVSWVVLVGWSLASLQKEVAEDELPGGYLGSVLPDGLKWLTVSDEMASWLAWEWRPVEVVELIREWLSLGKRRGLQGVVWKLKNRNEGFGGTWAWTYYAIQEMKSISERAGVICQFDLGRI